MKRTSLKRRHWAALALLTLSLAGCGGSDGISSPDPVATDDVPASAKISATGYTQFAAGLTKSETATGLDISQTTPPTSETEAPQTL
jgi:hypothetical protein